MKHVIWVLWPAFIAAGIAEAIFFTMIDPAQLYLFGQRVEWSAMATYSTGFLLFWLVCIGSSLMTYFDDAGTSPRRRSGKPPASVSTWRGDKRREPAGNAARSTTGRGRGRSAGRHGFETDRDAQQVLADACRRPLLRGDAAVRRRGRMRQRRLGIAEIGGDRQQTTAVDHLPGFGRAPLTTKETIAPPLFCCDARGRTADAKAGRDSRRAPPGDASPATRNLQRLADCAFRRICSVSSPFSSTQALNAESVGPAVRRNLNTSSVSFFGPATAPPRTRP
jgi:hypothetical protein